MWVDPIHGGILLLSFSPSLNQRGVDGLLNRPFFGLLLRLGHVPFLVCEVAYAVGVASAFAAGAPWFAWTGRVARFFGGASIILVDFLCHVISCLSGQGNI